MNGKIVAGGLVVSALIFGAGLWYATNYAHYEPIEASSDAAQVAVTTFEGAREDILAENFQGIDGDISPLKFRACFQTPLSLAMMTETFASYDAPVPLNAPSHFSCFDAQKIGADLENGTALAFVSEENFKYGFDRVVAIYPDGRGFAWTQLNACGHADAEGDPLPAGCPLPPEGN